MLKVFYIERKIEKLTKKQFDLINAKIHWQIFYAFIFIRCQWVVIHNSTDVVKIIKQKVIQIEENETSQEEYINKLVNEEYSHVSKKFIS